MCERRHKQTTVALGVTPEQKRTRTLTQSQEQRTNDRPNEGRGKERLPTRPTKDRGEAHL